MKLKLFSPIQEKIHVKKKKQAGAELGQAQHNLGWGRIFFGSSAQFEIYVIKLT